MKELVFSIFLILLSFSCSPIRFDQAQPSGEKELLKLPSKYCGVFVNRESDTLYVTQKSFQIEDDEVKEFSSDRVVLKKMGSYYIISCREFLLEGEPTDREGWEVYPFHLHKDSIIVYAMDLENEKRLKQNLSRLAAFTEIDSLNDGDEQYYLVHPTQSAFTAILDSGLFSEKIVYHRKKH